MFRVELQLGFTRVDPGLKPGDDIRGNTRRVGDRSMFEVIWCLEGSQSQHRHKESHCRNCNSVNSLQASHQSPPLGAIARQPPKFTQDSQGYSLQLQVLPYARPALAPFWQTLSWRIATPRERIPTDFAKVSLGLPAYFSGHATLSLGPAHDPRSHKAGKWLSTCKG